MDGFDLAPGRVLARKYEVVSLLGKGWEGEVYKVREIATDIERAAKFFYPQRNLRERRARFYAKKLHELRHCPILIQYHTHEQITIKRAPITFLLSDYVEGELLSQHLARQPGKRLGWFEALHLLHTLAEGMAMIHAMNEYHGDLHTENIIVRRYGIGYDIKLLDLYHWGGARPENIREDVHNLIRIFYDSMGGQKHYARLPPEVKGIVNGLKRSLIFKKYKNADQLCSYLETMEWEG